MFHFYQIFKNIFACLMKALFRVGLIGHLLKHHETYGEARAYMSGLIGTATSSTLGRSSGMYTVWDIKYYYWVDRNSFFLM